MRSTRLDYTKSRFTTGFKPRVSRFDLNKRELNGYLTTDGSSGTAIELTTSANYINNLAQWGIVSIALPNATTTNFGHYISAETAHNTGFYVYNSATKTDWQWRNTGTEQYYEKLTYALDERNVGVTVMNDASGTGLGASALDYGTAQDDAYNTPDAAHSTILALGAEAFDFTTAWRSVGGFGFTALLDLTGVTIGTGSAAITAFTTALCTRIKRTADQYNFDPNMLRKAIVDCDNNIDGVCWYLNNATTGIVPREITTGVAKSGWSNATLNGNVTIFTGE